MFPVVRAWLPAGRTPLALTVLAALLFVLPLRPLVAVTLPSGFSITPYVGGLAGPVDLEWSADGSLLFVAEKRGSVRVIDNGVLLPEPFVDLAGEVNKQSDRGLLGVALHPAFPATPWIYLLYTYDPPETAGQTGAAGPDGNGQRVSRLVRLTADAATGYRTAVAGSALILAGSASNWSNIGDPAADQIDLSAPWTCGPAGAYVVDCLPAEGLSHSIGTVKFGPDGMLYLGNGDAATWTTTDPRALRAIDPDSLAGKILRINPDTGAGLADNVFWDGNAISNRSKVFHLGMRNPYRFVFHPTTGALMVGDVGWEMWEELNQGPPGADFGWPCFEGGDGVLIQEAGYATTSECQTYYASNAATPAIWAFPHDETLGGALIPGDFYTGTAWPAAYHGALFAVDYASGTLTSIVIDAAGVTTTPFADDIVAVDLVFGPDDALYTADVTTGVIHRIDYSNTPLSVADIRVAAKTDDAEERASGSVTVKSSKLQLTYSSSYQTVGMRFSGVDIPAGAYVADAYIEFTSAGSSSATPDLLIQTQASDNAPTFVKANYNLSSRPRSASSQQWSPPPWSGSGQSGIDQRTPNLAVLVSEIVNRPGWQPGNAIVFLITGTGNHVAWSYNGQASAAPLLHLSWNDNPNAAPLVAITTPADGSAFTLASPITFAGSATDAEDNNAALTAALNWTSSLDGFIGSSGSFSTSTLSAGIHTITASVTDSGGASAQSSIDITVTTNNAPVASIDLPDPAATWVAGQQVTYSGTGTDAEDGTLSGSSLAWDGIIVHNSHEHLDFLSASGASGVFAYPDHDDNSHIELCLTATDSAGLGATDCAYLLPLEVIYTFETSPPGLNLAYNGLLQSTPFSVMAAAGGGRQISAPGPQGGYYFQSWNIGGGATQQIVIDSTDRTLSAVFNAKPVVGITAPANGAISAPGESLYFAGFATDVEDDDASLSSQLTWVSDVDGQIGAGTSFSVSSLSEGPHVVTASVTDSVGLVGQAQVSVTIGAVPDWAPVASFQDDFTANAPPAGWVYLWNRDAPIGNQSGYVPVYWNGAAYDSDGNSGLPDNTELRYGVLNAGGGHTGQGTDQGATADRYVIAAWTAQADASYRLVQSVLHKIGCQWTNGLDIRVFVNDSPKHQLAVPPGASGLSFDTDLGALATGDDIYVAAGPAGKDGCDAFLWDFTIERSTGGVPPNAAPSVSNPGDQMSQTGAQISLQIVATDANNDPLSYTMSGAPDGLAIDASSGLISGAATVSGVFATSVTVSDGQDDSTVSFVWTVTTAGQTWSTVAAYASDFSSAVPPGWLYQWNAGGPIGTAAGYQDLEWNGSSFDSDGAAGLPDSSGMGYGRLTATGGHAGRGAAQGEAFDHYAIAGFVIPAGGEYRIAQSFVAHTGCPWTDGVDVRVYLNDTLLAQLVVDDGGPTETFDVPLGTLLAGDRVYVSAGPSARDGCDAFGWDFSIEKSN